MPTYLHIGAEQEPCSLDIGAEQQGCSGSTPEPSTECTDAPPQMWLFSSTRKIGRHQEIATKDFMVGDSLLTGESIPDWVYSTGFSVTPVPTALKGIGVVSDAPVKVKAAKTVAGNIPEEAREVDVVPKEEVPLAWVPGMQDLRAYKLRVEFRGANETTLARAMVGRERVDGVGG